MKKRTVLVAALAAVPAAALTGFYLRCFAPPARRHDDSAPHGGQYEAKRRALDELHAAALADRYERVYIRSRDGLRLSGRYFPFSGGGGGPIVLFFHGYRSNALRDGGGLLKLMRGMGVDVLAPDQRAHGESEGRAITFGVKERCDCLDWIQYILDRWGEDKRIVLAGVSMGAATVLMASDRLPGNVLGIVADCGYTTPEAILRHVGKMQGLPVDAAMPLVRASARLLGGFDLRGASAPEALGRCRTPVLLIHGEADGFVPCEMSRENYAACAAPKRLLTIPGADHAMSFVIDEPAYTAAVREFLAECGATAD